MSQAERKPSIIQAVDEIDAALAQALGILTCLSISCAVGDSSSAPDPRQIEDTTQAVIDMLTRAKERFGEVSAAARRPASPPQKGGNGFEARSLQ